MFKRKQKTDSNLSIRWWYFVIIGALLIAPSVYLLRQNNLRMIELRQEVERIDAETADIEQIEPALLELRSYVLTHMNTGMATPVELVGSFNRAVEQAREEAEASGNANAKIYKEAQENCERREIPLSARASCIQDYVLQNAEPGEEATGVNLPTKEQFVYEFSSPVWSTDLAGFVVLLSALSFLTALILFYHQVVKVRIRKLITDDPLE